MTRQHPRQPMMRQSQLEDDPPAYTPPMPMPSNMAASFRRRVTAVSFSTANTLSA